MKTKKGLKRITALIMCVILLVTSLPIALAAGETAYNPAPYFDDVAQNKGAAAWMDTYGNLQVRFPKATGRPTYNEWKGGGNTAKAIAYYIVELSNIGEKLTKHKETPEVLLTKKIEVGTGTETLATVELLSAVFTSSELKALGAAFNLDTTRYNISITAVDSESWFSLPMDALVSEVPEFNYDMTGFELLTEHETAMREMMRFEAEGDYTDTMQVGDTVSQLTSTNYNGADDPGSGIPTKAFRVRINANGTQKIDTPVSRQAYDFMGASEVWYWLDLTDVELKGLSFQMYANYKKIDYNQNGPAVNRTAQHRGNVAYSTLGTNYNTYAAGEEPYVLVQQENGTWKKITMTNGTVDLGHMKGYVRIPIQFFCSETETRVETNNTWAGTSGDMGNAPGRDNEFQAKYSLSTKFEWNSETNRPNYDTHVLVDPAGTPVSDALLIQQARLYFKRGILSDKYSYEMDSCLAPGVNDADIKKADNPNRAYMVKDESAPDGWRVENRENGYKALNDIYSAGLAYQSVTEDSLHHSFFVDNVMFLRSDGGTWEPNVLNGVTSTGNPISDYFNQKTYAQDQVLDAIDAYIGEPSWTDYRGVHYVESMIKAYYDAYVNAGASYGYQFLTDEEMQKYADATGRGYVWKNYKEAMLLCQQMGTYYTNNSKPDELVPDIVQLLDTLPDPATITTVSDEELKLLIRLYQSYSALNYGQLKMLGSYVDPVSGLQFEEEKLLAYISFLGEELNQSFLTGYKLANYPFIPFNTFEENTSVGDKAWRLEDDPNYYGVNDYRHYKNFSTLTDKVWLANPMWPDASENLDINHFFEALHDYSNSGDTAISRSGYNGSKGLSTTFKSAAVQGNISNGVFYRIWMNRDSVNNITNYDDYKKNNMGKDYNLGQLAYNNNEALVGNTYLPFSLVMYVDFSEFTEESGAHDFAFNMTIHTTDGNGAALSYRPAMGVGGSGSAEWRSYYMLDEASGEWKRVYIGSRTAGNYMFPSNDNVSGGETAAKLAGYKGYIAVPMNHFKRGSTDNDFLVTNATALNNIYSIQFTIANVNGAAMYGKSFTIDNIGFTYDPAFYTSKGIDTANRGDKTYADVFHAKSNKAQEFEDKVASIDQYDTPENLTTLVAEADAIYAMLGEFQRTGVQSVIESKKRLELYRTYANGTDSPEPIVRDLAWLRDKINNEWSTIPDVSSMLLPNPGFKYPDGANEFTPSEVKYETFGLTAEMAQEIISGYNETSERLAPQDYALLTEDEVRILENAYAAAMRSSIALETTKAQAEGFADALQSLYTTYTDVDYGGITHRFFHAADTASDGTTRSDVVDFAEHVYDPLPYYAKSELSKGNIIKAYANMTDGIARYLANTKTVTMKKADGTDETVQAGVWKLAKKYSDLYSELKPALDNKTLLDANNNNLLTRVREAIAEYNDLIPAYKNIFELYYGSVQADASGEYQGIKDIMDLFVRADASFADTGTKESTLALTEDNIATESRTLNLNYLEEYTVAAGGDSSTYFTLKYDGVLSAGVTQRHYKLMLNGNEIPSVAYDAAGIQLTEKMLGGTLKNDTYTEANLFAMAFTAELTDTELFMEQLSDLVTIVHYRPADPDKGETEPQELGTYKLHVTYTPKEAYTVRIPAEFPIAWGTPETDVSYSVDCALKEGSSVTVEVKGNNKLIAEKDSAFTMDYTPKNFGSAVFQGVRNGAKPALLPTVAIGDEMWTTKPLDKYSDTLTYTVEYKSAP